MMRDDCQAWHERSYEVGGFGSQRKYPNEEFCRFVGRNYGHVPRETRRLISFLELGCGSGSNIWMVQKEGFAAHGIDFSEGAIQQCAITQSQFGVQFKTRIGDMRKLDMPDACFDVVYDVFSTYCLDEQEIEQCLDEVSRVLKRGGKFFTYAPSKGSDVFKRSTAEDRLDGSTLDGIRIEGTPFYGNSYPFRFVSKDEARAMMEKRGLRVPYLETVSRTYKGGTAYFEFVVMEAVKP